MLIPPETHCFRNVIVFYSGFCCFLPSKVANIFFIHLKTLDAWSSWVMMLRVDTMTYFDGMWSVFDYRVVSPAKGFNSNIDRMRKALWPNVNFKLYIGLYSVSIPFCDTWNLGFWTPSDLADILFDDQYGRYFLGLFFLTM